MCMGKRFGEYELRALASVLFSRSAAGAAVNPDPQDRDDSDARPQRRAALRRPATVIDPTMPTAALDEEQLARLQANEG